MLTGPPPKFHETRDILATAAQTDHGRCMYRTSAKVAADAIAIGRSLVTERYAPRHSRDPTRLRLLAPVNVGV
jgi:hypothetical protein